MRHPTEFSVPPKEIVRGQRIRGKFEQNVASPIPVLPYPDVNQAIDWLCQAFGFTLRLRIGDHRAQLNVGDGAIVITKEQKSISAIAGSVMVRVEDVYRHSAVAERHGANLLSSPADFPYGERQYTCEDIAGHRWTFSQTLSDSNPQDWGGTLTNIHIVSAISIIDPVSRKTRDVGLAGESQYVYCTRIR